MKKFLYFISGCVVTSMLFIPAMIFADTGKTISALYGQVKIIIDGNDIGNDTIVYNDYTYVPLRKVYDSFGTVITYDKKNKIAFIDSSKSEAATTAYYKNFPNVPTFEAITSIKNVEALEDSARTYKFKVSKEKCTQYNYITYLQALLNEGFKDQSKGNITILTKSNDKVAIESTNEDYSFVLSKISSN